MIRCSWWAAFLAAATFVSASIPAQEKYVPGDEESCQTRNHGVDNPWVVPLVIQAMLDYIPSGKYEEDQCTKDGQTYAIHLRNFTYWAAKMYDSSSYGSVSGVLEGQNVNFGHFDECVSSKSDVHGITGKYITAKLEFEPFREINPHFYEPTEVWTEPDNEDSAWTAIKPTKDWRMRRMNEFYWGFCVPSSCKDTDIEAGLQKRLYPSLASKKIAGNLTIFSKLSYSRATDYYTPGVTIYFFLAAVSIIIFVVIYSSFKDWCSDESESKQKPWWTDFSMRKNYSDLKTTSSEFLGLSGIKLYSQFIVVLAHRLLFSILVPQFNLKNMQLKGGQFFYTIFFNISPIVNTFMVITGFLTFYKITDDVNKNKKLNVWGKICHRWLRLTPAYLAVMAFQHYILPYSEGGPIRKSIIWDIGSFGEYWWTHLLYINNYVEPSGQVLLPSWYFAVDMQMYIVCYILGALLQKKWNLTPYVLSFLSILALCLAIPSIVSTRTYGALRMDFKLFYDIRSHQQFLDMYIQTHKRAAPYLIGMLGGYIYYYFKKQSITFSRMTYNIASVLSLFVMILCLCIAYVFFQPGREYVLWENVSYVVLHRLFWSLAICTLIFATAIGKIDLLMVPLGIRAFETLNKLNYGTLLAHSVIQNWLFVTMRAPENVGWILGIWMGTADIVFSYFTSFFLYLFIEGPFLNLQRRLPF